MKDPLVRFGVAIEGSLLRELDALARKRGCTRSELLRDLGRAEVGRAKVPDGVDAVGALTLVYDHHTRDLSEKLTALQHDLGDDVRAAMHVHLSHDLCLEVIVLRGRSDRLAALADQILAIRGVKHGGIEIVSSVDVAGHTHDDGHVHLHDHGHDHDHDHPHPHPPTAPARRRARTRRK
jgi:CopG family transcriptional regulator, nickel-responsive regulator